MTTPSDLAQEIADIAGTAGIGQVEIHEPPPLTEEFIRSWLDSFKHAPVANWRTVTVEPV